MNSWCPKTRNTNTITIYFEEKINVRYLEFDNTKAGKNTNTIKTYRITAYS